MSFPDHCLSFYFVMKSLKNIISDSVENGDKLVETAIKAFGRIGT